MLLSTSEQADSGLGLAAQRAAIIDEAKRRGWQLLDIYEDAGASAKTTARRPALAKALDAVEKGEAEALVVAKLDRLSRSMTDFTRLMERSWKKGWALVALDLGVDTSTAAGEMIANSVANFSQFERRLIGQQRRTRSRSSGRRACGWGGLRSCVRTWCDESRPCGRGACRSGGSPRPSTRRGYRRR